MEYPILYHVNPQPENNSLEIGELYLLANGKLGKWDGQNFSRVKTPNSYYVAINNEMDGEVIYIEDKKIGNSIIQKQLADGLFFDSDANCVVNCLNSIFVPQETNILFARNFRFQKYEIEKDFALFNRQINEELFFFQARDGIAQTNEEQGLVITSTPFRTRNPCFFDRIKYMSEAIETFDVPRNNQWIFFETKMAFEGTGMEAAAEQYLALDNTCIKNIADEPRLANGQVFFYDPDNGMVFGFTFSNQVIYATYDRWPIVIESLYDNLDKGGSRVIESLYDSLGEKFDMNPEENINKNVQEHLPEYFGASKPVMLRTSNPHDLIKLKVMYNGYRKIVRWYLEDKLVWEIVNPGLKPVKNNLINYLAVSAKRENNDAYITRQVVVSKKLKLALGMFTNLGILPYVETVGKKMALENIYNSKIKIEIPLDRDNYTVIGKEGFILDKSKEQVQGGILIVNSVLVGTIVDK